VILSAKISYYTKEGLEKLKNDLNQLKTKGRADIAKQIAEARDKGDLSENAEYDAAKDAQGHLEARIAKLEDLVGNAREIDESTLNTSSVSILSKVTIKNKKNGASFTYTLVSEEEADLKLNKISTQSPIGKGLLGKEKGDSAKIKTPAGEIEFEIIKIEI
jgi:transcription elongation factor GreA